MAHPSNSNSNVRPFIRTGTAMHLAAHLTIEPFNFGSVPFVVPGVWNEESSAQMANVLDKALDIAHLTVEQGGGLLNLAPVQGLDTAADVIKAVIEKIQKARDNDGLRTGLVNSLSSLLSIVKETSGKVNEKSILWDRSMEAGGANQGTKKLVEDLRMRIGKLFTDMKSIAVDAMKLSEEGKLKKILHAEKNAGTLRDLKGKVDDAFREFIFRNNTAIQLLVIEVNDKIDVIVQNQLHDREEQKRKDDDETLDKLSHIDASYLANVVHSVKGGLTEGTRVTILEDIEEWATRPPTDKDQPIFLMKGAFGTGKSAIAHEIAKRLDGERRLSASYFFLRGTDLGSPDRFFSTIARQLAFSQPLLRSHIIKAARNFAKHGVDKASMESQAQELLVEPLKLAPKDHPPIVIVMDGLDECAENDLDSRSQMLTLLFDATRKIPITLRIVVATRPIPDIERSFQFSDKKELILHDVPRAAVDSDINVYLKNALSAEVQTILKEEHPGAIDDLTTMAEGHFIFATTAVKFITERPRFSSRFFNQLYSRMSEKGAAHLDKVDRLYTVILETSLSELLEDPALPNVVDLVRKVLSSVALLREQLSLSALTALLSTHESDADVIAEIFEALKSVILLPNDPDKPIRSLHASFPQFLIDRERCTDVRFYVDESEGHGILAIACLGQFNQPGRVLRVAALSFGGLLGYCRNNWVAHLAASSLTPGLMDALKAFRKLNENFVREELIIMGYYDEPSGESAGASAQTRQGDVTGAELEYYCKHINKLKALWHADLNRHYLANGESVEGTRVATLEDIEEWAMRPATDLDEPILTLTGAPDVARETINRFEEKKFPVANYFFRRDDFGSDPAFLFSSIMCQIAASMPSLRPHIVKAARDVGYSAHKMQDVFMEALEKLKAKAETISPILVIIVFLDGDDKTHVDWVGRMQSIAKQATPIALRSLITSKRSSVLKQKLGVRTYDSAIHSPNIH